MLELNRVAIYSLDPKLVPTLRPNHKHDTGIPFKGYLHRTLSQFWILSQRNIIYSIQLGFAAGSFFWFILLNAAFCYIIKLLFLRLLLESPVILLEKKNSLVVNILSIFLGYFVGHPDRRESMDF